MTAALQSYADRGVFRGFRATAARRGRIDYQFLWLTKKPMRATFDPTAGTVKFPSLFPGVDTDAARDLKSILASRRHRSQPRHRRIDARRARVSGTLNAGGFGLVVEIRGRNDGYAVRHALNLINELFVALQERHPEYLVERFGFSAE